MDKYEPRPWGGFSVLDTGRKFWVKKLVIAPLSRISLQKHEHRAEAWVCVEGEGIATVIDFPRTLKNGDKTYMMPGTRVYVPQGATHRIDNPHKKRLIVVEVALGDLLSEEDIIRYGDDYGRVCEEQDPE